MFRKLIEEIIQHLELTEDDEAYIGSLKIGQKPGEGEAGYGGHKVEKPAPPVAARKTKMGPPPLPKGVGKKSPPPIPQKKPLNPWGSSDEQ